MVGAGEEMTRSSSGGVKIGKQIIEFGDFPEKIDVDVVRERAWRRLLEKEREERVRIEDRARARALAGHDEEGGGNGMGSGLGIRM